MNNQIRFIMNLNITISFEFCSAWERIQIERVWRERL